MACDTKETATQVRPGDTASLTRGDDAMRSKTVEELRAAARARGLTGCSKLRKDELLRLLARKISTKAVKPVKPVKPVKTVKAVKRVKVAKPAKRAKGSAPRKRITLTTATKKPRALRPSTPTRAAVPAPRSRPAKPTSQARAQTARAPTDEDRVESAKFSSALPDHDLTAPFVSADLGEDIECLPLLPGPLLGLLPQKPGILHGYWALEPGSLRHQPDLRIRLCRIRDRVLEVLDDIPLPGDSGRWYFHVGELPADSELYAQLGHYRPDGTFVTAIRRGIARVPSLHPSAHTDANWWISEADFRKMYARTGGRVDGRNLVWSASVSSR